MHLTSRRYRGRAILLTVQLRGWFFRAIRLVYAYWYYHDHVGPIPSWQQAWRVENGEWKTENGEKLCMLPLKVSAGDGDMHASQMIISPIQAAAARGLSVSFFIPGAAPHPRPICPTINKSVSHFLELIALNFSTIGFSRRNLPLIILAGSCSLGQLPLRFLSHCTSLEAPLL